MTDWFAFITPEPAAPAAWSPAPPDIITLFLKPIFFANFLLTYVDTSEPSTKFGILSIDNEVNSKSLLDQFLFFTLNHSVPDASDISVTKSPDNFNLKKSLGSNPL